MKPEIEIYGSIGDEESGVTVKSVSDQLKEIGDVDEITVRISSEGGSVTQGLAIANLLKKHPAEIHTVIEGGAFSMAGYLACCGDKRTIAKDALLHVHGPRLGTEGNLVDHEDSVKQLRIATEAMVGRYAELSGRSNEDIERDFERDLFYDASEAIAIGYMTDIGDESEVVAEFDSKKLPKIPKRYAAALARPSGSSKETGEEKMPKTAAASLKEMKAKFQNASSDFILGQAVAEATMEEATAAYISELEGQNNDLEKTVAKLEANAEMDEEETETTKASKDDESSLLAKIKAMINGEDEEEEEVGAEEGEEDLAEAVLALLSKQNKTSKKAKASKKSKGRHRFGADPVRTSSASRKGSGSAKSQLSTMVAQAMKDDSNLKKHHAVRQVLLEHPELRDALNES